MWGNGQKALGLYGFFLVADFATRFVINLLALRAFAASSLIDAVAANLSAIEIFVKSPLERDTISPCGKSGRERWNATNSSCALCVFVGTIFLTIGPPARFLGLRL